MSTGKSIKALSGVSIMRMVEQAKPTYGKQQEILDSIREQRPGIVLENASDRWVTAYYDGTKYQIAPKGVSVNPDTGLPGDYDGTITIHDDYRRDPRKVKALHRQILIGKLKPGSTVPANILKATADAIASSLWKRTEKYGVFHVTGDPEVDAKRRDFAARRALANRIERSEMIVAAYWRKAETFKADAKNAGKQLRMSDEQRDAMEFLDGDPEASLDTARIYCRGSKCPFWSYELSSILLHEQKRHPELLPRDEEVVVEEPPAMTPKKSKRAAVGAEA